MDDAARREWLIEATEDEAVMWWHEEGDRPFRFVRAMAFLDVGLKLDLLSESDWSRLHEEITKRKPGGSALSPEM